MERDFLGLGSKNKPVVVKEEIIDLSNDSELSRASAMQWSFSNKVSALPQFLSFKASQDDGSSKTGFDSLTSTGFMTISNAETFNLNHKQYSSIMQKNFAPDKQTGTHYTVTTYPPQQFDVRQSHEVRILPIVNQTNQNISITMSNPAHQSVIAFSGQNVISGAVKPHSFGGVPVISPVSIAPVNTSIVGTTELRNASKPPGGPAQLTIFYAGSVCVYDDASPEKAQAIMLLAGNGQSTTLKKTQPTAQVQAPVPRPPCLDGFIGNHSQVITYPCPALPSPISVTSRAVPQSAGGSSSSTDRTAARTIGTLTTTSNRPEPSKVICSVGPVSATPKSSTPNPSAVPQFRKASLARFLEKRKERVMNTSPYVSKQSPDCSTPGSDNRSSSSSRHQLEFGRDQDYSNQVNKSYKQENHLQ